MKKRLIGFMVLLVFFGGMIYAEEKEEEKKKFSLKLEYEKASVETEMKELAVIELWISPYDDLWWSKRTMEALNTESFDKFYLKASYPFLNRFEIYGKIGVLTVESTFQNPAVRWSNGYGDKIYQQDQPLISEDNIQGISKKGFLVGAGIDFLIFEKEGFKINLDLNYLYHWVNTEIMIEEEHYKSRYFYEEQIESGWDKEIKIEKIKIQELRIALPISQRIGKFLITAGPELMWTRNEYKGRYLLEYFSTFSVHTEWSNYEKRDRDINFETCNVKKLNGFAEAQYLFSKNVGILIRAVTGAEKGFAVGWNWSFNL